MNTIRALVRQYICEALGVTEDDLEGPPERKSPPMLSNGHLEAPEAPEVAPETRLTLTAQEFSAQTGVSLSTVYQLVRRGLIKRAPHPGTRVLIPARELDKYR
jgi:excisionase family DNA binding protein